MLYLDSREKGALLSRAARAALETLATEAAVAIENARLYRETLEKARMEQELKIAAEIQQALLPEPQRQGRVTSKPSAQSVPCRSIGGDFFDYVDLPTGELRVRRRRRGRQGRSGRAADRGHPGRVLVAGLLGHPAVGDALEGQPGDHPPRDRVALLHGVLRRRPRGRRS